MKRRGPLLTLAAAAVLGIGLLFINVSKEDKDPAPAAQTSIAATSSAPAADDAEPPATPPVAAGEQFPALQDYVGQADAGNITVSITVEGDEAVAYVCDGAAVEAWLTGTAIDGALDVKNANGATLTGRLEGQDVNGTLWIPGQAANAFTAAPVAPPNGIYVSNQDGVRQSWIVSDAGTVGVQRDAQGNESPAPALTLSLIHI